MGDIALTEAGAALPAGIEAEAVGLAKLLEEHKAKDPVVLDLRGLNSWTDFFVVATVTSSTHLKGLLRHVKERVKERGLEILHGHSGSAADEWSFMDLGDIVVHLMTEKARAFYELERLWHQARGSFSPPRAE